MSNFELRLQFFGKYNGRCMWCEQVIPFREATLEHIHPVCFGGPKKDSNLGIACQKCNNERGQATGFEKHQVNTIKFLETAKRKVRIYRRFLRHVERQKHMLKKWLPLHQKIGYELDMQKALEDVVQRVAKVWDRHASKKDKQHFEQLKRHEHV